MTQPDGTLEALRTEFPAWTIRYDGNCWTADLLTPDTRIMCWQDTPSQLRERIRFHAAALRELANKQHTLTVRGTIDQ